MKLTSDLVIFVTGGASGLGEATVKYLHAAGCKVAAVDHNDKNLKKLKDTLKTNILCIKCDVTKEEQVKKAIDHTVKEFGTIHAIVTSAGATI